MKSSFGSWNASAIVCSQCASTSSSSSIIPTRSPVVDAMPALSAFDFPRRRSSITDTRPGWTACSRRTSSPDWSAQALQMTVTWTSSPSAGAAWSTDRTHRSSIGARLCVGIRTSSRSLGPMAALTDSNRDTAVLWRSACTNRGRETRSSNRLPLLPPLALRAVAHDGYPGLTVCRRLPPCGSGRAPARSACHETDHRRAGLRPRGASRTSVPPARPCLPRRQWPRLSDSLTSGLRRGYGEASRP